jgi:Ca-activated chloride channel family protein
MGAGKLTAGVGASRAFAFASARFSGPLALFVCLGAVLSSPLVAQVAGQPGQAGQAGQAGQTPTFRSSAEVVLVDVSVVDTTGAPVMDLEREDFELWEDGARQPIVYFNREFADEPTPASLVLLLDISSSMTGDAMTQARSAASDFVRRIPDEAEIALLVFDDQVLTACPFTRNRAELEAAIETLEAGGGTAFYDALAEALDLFEEASHRRKVLVVLSDGKDLDSRESFIRIEERFEQSPIVVYALGYYKESEHDLYLTGDKYYKEPAFAVNLNPAWVLERLASLSGGVVLFPKRRDELGPFFAEIASELNHQYVLGYSPTPTTGEPRFRAIDVRVLESGARGGSVDVRARRGYVR